MLPASYNPGIELYHPPRPARFVLGETRKERAALRPTAAVCKAKIKGQILAEMGEGPSHRQLAGQDELVDTLPV